MSSLRNGRAGQATLEYIALVSLVVVVIGAAAALTSGGLGGEIAYGMRRGLCAVAGAACPTRPRDVADLPPCPKMRSSKGEDFSVTVAFVRLGAGLGVLEERTSDGRVTVTFTDSGAAGLTAGVGAHFALGQGRVGAELNGDVGVTFGTGRSWAFAGQAQADAFVRHYGSDQTMAGRLANDARRACPLCHLIGWEPDKPPPPDAVFLEGGARAGAEAIAGAGLHAGLRAALEGALGRREGRDGRTWYVRLDAGAAGRLYAGMGLGATAGAAALAELTTDRGGRPQRLVVRIARRWSTGTAGGDGAPVAPKLEGGGGLTETETVLDLADGRSREAALAFLDAGAVAPLLARLRERGVSTLRTYRLRDSHDGLEGAVGVGAVAGGGFGRDSQRLDLTGVATRLPGLGFLPRADCLEQ